MSSSKLMTYYIQRHNEGFSVISNRQPFNERVEGAQTQTVYIYKLQRLHILILYNKPPSRGRIL